MSALPTKADVRLAVQKCALCISGKWFCCVVLATHLASCLAVFARICARVFAVAYRMPDEVALVLEAVVVVGGLIAAAFWLASANVTVLDDQDSFIAALQRIGKLNSIGAAGASAAAIAALVLWTTSG
jgi:hypothetical protein